MKLDMRHFALTTLLGVCITAGATEPVTIDKFAWRQAIQLTSPDQAIYRFELPAAVYVQSRRDLGDLRFFNAAGELVPHALLRHEPTTTDNVLSQHPLTFFPLHRDVQGKDSMSVSVHRDQMGTLIATTIDTAQAPNVPSPRRIGYLIDASSAPERHRTLLLDWIEPTSGITLAVQIEGSDNLQDWHRIASNTQLIDLRAGTQRLIQNRIELGDGTHRYYRLRWQEEREGIDLTAVSLETSTLAAPPDRTHWQPATVLRSEEDSGEFRFDSAGLPVTQVRLSLPTPNTVVPVTVQYRSSDGAAWTTATRTIAFRLSNHGEETVSPPIAVCCGSNRHWRLLFEQSGGGIGSGLPTVEVGWAPQQGLFVARGPAPFVLASGNDTINGTSATAASLVPNYRPEQYPDLAIATFDSPQAQVRTVTATPQEATGLPWRTYVLWTILVAGVLLLAGMVWRLQRQLNATEGGNQ